MENSTLYDKALEYLKDVLKHSYIKLPNGDNLDLGHAIKVSNIVKHITNNNEQYVIASLLMNVILIRGGESFELAQKFGNDIVNTILNISYDYDNYNVNIVLWQENILRDANKDETMIILADRLVTSRDLNQMEIKYANYFANETNYLFFHYLSKNDYHENHLHLLDELQKNITYFITRPNFPCF